MQPLVATLSKNRLQHRCFPANIAKYFRTAFFIEHLQWPLLKVGNYVLYIYAMYCFQSLLKCFFLQQKYIMFKVLPCRNKMYGTVHYVCRRVGQRVFVGAMKYFRHILMGLEIFFKIFNGLQNIFLCSIFVILFFKLKGLQHKISKLAIKEV